VKQGVQTQEKKDTYRRFLYMHITLPITNHTRLYRVFQNMCPYCQRTLLCIAGENMKVKERAKN
jgi:hypothetical protein